MTQVLTVNYDEKPIYDIRLEDNYDNLLQIFDRVPISNRKVCIVTDTNVGKYYLDTVKQILYKDGAKVETFTFPAGEENKTLNTVKDLYEHLILSGFDRKDLLVALGGGVVGDLTGYAAATYLRGISFIQLPTSLLSMVDSSIGGKTGVDFDSYKNMVGAFHQPGGVYINLNTLKSLSDKQFFSGLGEIIKHGLIKDREYFEWLKTNRLKIEQKDIKTLQEMVYRSCVIKRDVVEKDFRESGERALLNFGHTIGHSIEKLMDFQLFHGECVAIGMVAAAYLSYKRGNVSKEDFEDIVQTIKGFNLPSKITGISKEEILRVAKSDKKMNAGKINFILLEEIGKAVIDSSVTDEEILETLDYIIY
ncbi:3-dehydroquinate synthase [Mobilisporobacter senegalensis]|uniref:3-dehydroquinate synthase n=1 Tax=Mobilisporobacter senegalensis TaxID=1329262 RepID=A0A3N1XR91_9FIRM|nr:3-dehydroquinate synthase [Mobilisporobacter senegalensis]ROR29156.1 3-dehydroquinate synthase [Mobilisporobacter senegalensis]